MAESKENDAGAGWRGRKATFNSESTKTPVGTFKEVPLAANGCLRENDEPHFSKITFDCCMGNVLERDKYGSNETSK